MQMSNFVMKALQILDQNKVPLDKIVIQKFIYFLKTQGLPARYTFKPYTYGPFSSALHKELDDLVFWDRLSCKDHTYSILDTKENLIDNETAERLGSAFQLFKRIAKEDYTFDNMELIGTVLFCSQSIKDAKEEVSFDAVKKEFFEWKEDTAYTEEQIKTTYDTLFQ